MGTGIKRERRRLGRRPGWREGRNWNEGRLGGEEEGWEGGRPGWRERERERGRLRGGTVSKAHRDAICRPQAGSCHTSIALLFPISYFLPREKVPAGPRPHLDRTILWPCPSQPLRQMQCPGCSLCLSTTFFIIRFLGSALPPRWGTGALWCPDVPRPVLFPLTSVVSECLGHQWAPWACGSQQSPNPFPDCSCTQDGPQQPGRPLLRQENKPRPGLSTELLQQGGSPPLEASKVPTTTHASYRRKPLPPWRNHACSWEPQSRTHSCP